MTAAKELRVKTREELKNQLLELRRSQLETRIQKSTEQIANTARIKEDRKDIARIKTILNEKQNSE
jgi:large subunit ribosomal protein L29